MAANACSRWEQTVREQEMLAGRQPAANRKAGNVEAHHGAMLFHCRNASICFSVADMPILGMGNQNRYSPNNGKNMGMCGVMAQGTW